MPSGQARPRRNSWFSACCHHAGSATSLVFSTLKGAFTTFTESPRTWLKPMVSRTRAVICSSCAAGMATVVSLPFLSVVVRWLITTAALRRLIWPLDSRTTFTVLSTS